MTWRQRYKKYRRTMLVAAKQKRLEVTSFLWLLKIMEPCVDCGKHYDPECMEFDHVQPVLRRRVGTIAGCWSWVIEELERCEIVCANCHRKRTFQRQQQERQ